MYGYGFEKQKKTGFRWKSCGEKSKAEKKIFLFGIFLLLAAVLSFSAGVFLYHRPGENAKTLLQKLYTGILCGFFRGKPSVWELSKSYLLIIAPLPLLFVSCFGALTFPYCFLIIAGKGLLSGYTCAALLDLQAPGAGGILRFLFFLLFEGAILLLTLSFAREGLIFREETRRLPSIPAKKWRPLFLDMLFLCGVSLLLFFLRGLLCGIG